MIDQIIVFDDLRVLPIESTGGDVPIIHCVDEDSFLIALENARGKTVQLILDHDLGGVAFGEITARKGIRTFTEMFERQEIILDVAVIVTMNPAGRDWIVSELKSVGIHPQIDPGGVMCGMNAPKGWQ